MKIKYYKNFLKDRRPSMDQYADQLFNYQSKNYTNHEISIFNPSEDYISKLIFSNKWKLRYLRYISYSRQVNLQNFGRGLRPVRSRLNRANHKKKISRIHLLTGSNIYACHFVR